MSLLRQLPLHHTDVVAPEGLRRGTVGRSVVLALLGSVLVALCSHVAFSLPFTPVPFTLQPFAVVLVGLLLGPTAGFGAMALYLVEGATGVPVFTPVGLPGVARLLGPTGGFLFAYPLAAGLAGLAVYGRKQYSFAWNAATGLLAMAVIYLFGCLWFSHVLQVPYAAAMHGALLPFAAADLVKLCAAAGIASALRAYKPLV